MLFRSDRKSTRLNSSHTIISYAVFCLKKKERPASRPHPSRLSRVLLASRAGPARIARVFCPTSHTHPETSLISLLVFLFFFLMNGAPPRFTLFPRPAPLQI